MRKHRKAVRPRKGASIRVSPRRHTRPAADGTDDLVRDAWQEYQGLRTRLLTHTFRRCWQTQIEVSDV